MFSYWRHIVLALSVSQLLIAPPAASAQAATDTTAPAPSDTTAPAPSDSLAARGDTASPAGRDTTDTLSRTRSDSVPDSLRTAPSAPARAGTVRARSDSVPAAPVDSVL